MCNFMQFSGCMQPDFYSFWNPFYTMQSSERISEQIFFDKNEREKNTIMHIGPSIVGEGYLYMRPLDLAKFGGRVPSAPCRYHDILAAVRGS